MRPFILLGGHLWRGGPARSHAAPGSHFAAENGAVNVDFADLDSSRRHT